MMLIIIIAVILIAAILLAILFLSKGKKEDQAIQLELEEDKIERERILCEYREKSKDTSDILTVCFPKGPGIFRTEVHCFKDGEEMGMNGQDFKQNVFLDKLTLTTIEDNGTPYKGIGFSTRRIMHGSNMSGSGNSSDYFEADSGYYGGSDRSDDEPTLYHNWYADRGEVIEDSYGNTSDYNGRSYSDY